MIYGVSIVLIIALFVAFAVQNGVPVTVVFLIWEWETSFVLVVIAAVVAGALLALSANALKSRRRAGTYRNLELLSRRHRW